MQQEFSRPRIVKTKDLRIPNYYTVAINGEFSKYAFDEERGPLNKGKWRDEVFQIHADQPIDLEIGTGNGVHFQHHCRKFPERNLLGIEIKYKPLIQSIRGMLKQGHTNGRICRFHAFNLDQLIEAQEINDIYIHFPDPWTSPRKPRNRLVNPRMLDLFFEMQRPGSKIEFKTDSLEYFDWSLEHIQNSKYQIEFQTYDLANSPQAENNVVTSFERIFSSQGIKINYIRLVRP